MSNKTIYTEYIHELVEKQQSVKNDIKNLEESKINIASLLMGILEPEITIDDIIIDERMNMRINLNIDIHGILIKPEIDMPLEFDHVIVITKKMIEDQYRNLVAKTEAFEH